MDGPNRKNHAKLDQSRLLIFSELGRPIQTGPRPGPVKSSRTMLDSSSSKLNIAIALDRVEIIVVHTCEYQSKFFKEFSVSKNGRNLSTD